MNPGAPTFDESWHRVEGRQIRLRPGVEIFAQRFRGQRWYVVRDALGNQFFRIRPPAYRFICEVERSETVGEAWERSLELDPEEAPGQGEVVQLLSQLHRSGLLRSDLEGDVAALFEAHQKEQRRQTGAQWANLLFFRIPLFNPDALLRRTLPWVGWMISRPGFVVWLIAMFLGARAIVENWQQFLAESGGILGAANLPWLYLAIIVTKGLHEFGHGWFCRKFGGEVPQMGVMLLLLNPMPYVDASSSWAFRDKWRRALVGAAGMIVELLLAAVAAVVWANTGQGVAHSVAGNIVVIASIGTLLFNLNPLLRFDGYHILSDLLEVPNLQSRATRTALYMVEHYLFGLPHAVNPAGSRKESIWLLVFFVASFAYRIVLLAGILFFISRRFLVIGVILALIFGFLWLVKPVFKALHYLLSNPRLEARRSRAVGLSLGIVGGILAALVLVPVPNHFRAPGVVRADPFSRVYAGASGKLVEVLVPSGSVVAGGAPLLRLESDELNAELRLVELDLVKAGAQERHALEDDPARRLSLQGYVIALEARRRQLLEEREALVVKAPCAGRWIAPEIGILRGSTLHRGMEVGLVQGEARHYISAVVRQADVARLFGGNVHATQVKVRGQEGITLGVSDFQAIPAEHGDLPSAALGLMGGGQASVSGEQETTGMRPLAGRGVVSSSGSGRGTRTTEPFFEVRAFLVPHDGSTLLHGQQGVARINLPWEPLMIQWVRALRQLFQRSYRV